MAQALILARGQYLNGVVPLYRGDRWQIDAQLAQRYNGVNVPVDLSQIAASGITAFFPAATGGVIPVLASILPGQQGNIHITVPETCTANVALVPDPSTWYVQAGLTSGPTTFETPDFPITINDPGFNT